jgi:spore coat protein CotH
MNKPCNLCELEAEIRARSDELRHLLQKLNPQTDPGYDELFSQLVDVDHTLRMLRGGVTSS